MNGTPRNPTIDPPAPGPHTRYRIIGPKQKNGMNCWAVHPCKDGVLGPQEGPDCLSLDQAICRAKELAEGKRLFFFGGVTFERKAL